MAVQAAGMQLRGMFTPETATAARERYESLALPAETVTKELAEAGTGSADAYREFLTPEVLDTAQQSLFAGLLAVRVGSREEYEEWLADHEDLTPTLAGHESVARRAWHPINPRDAVAAVSFEDSPDAAVATVRRQAFGKHYRSVLGLA